MVDVERGIWEGVSVRVAAGAHLLSGRLPMAALAVLLYNRSLSELISAFKSGKDSS